jgi:DnaA family protein
VKQLLLDIQPAPAPSLENFVPGRNAELLAVLRVLTQGEPGKRSLYLWGESGSGRSHMLQAAVAHFRQQGLAAQYATDSAALENCDLIALDNVEKLDETGQIALFNLFNQLRDCGRALIVSGPCAPSQLNIRDDLKTRLGWGLVYQVLALSGAEKTEALQRHAAERGFQLPKEVVDYLLRHVRRDLPTLMGMLDALDEWSLTAKKPVTVPLLRQLLQLPLNLD